MDRRVFTTILVCLAILVAWQALGPRIFPHWFPEPPTLEEPAEEALPEIPEPVVEPEVEVAEDVPSVRPEEEVVLENPRIRAVLTSRGAALKSWTLQEDRFVRQLNGEVAQVDLVMPHEDDPLPLSTTFEELEWPADASYQVVDRSADSVTFRAQAAGLVVDKRYHLPADHYHVALVVTVRDAGGDVRTLTPTVHMSRLVPEWQRARRGFLSFAIPDVVLPACVADGSLVRREHDDEVLEATLPGAARWAGIDERYFLTAVFAGRPDFEPPADGPAELGTCSLASAAPYRYDARLTLAALSIPVGGEAEERLTGYFGPKFKSVLDQYGNGLDEAVDFGFFTVLSMLLLWVMIFFEGLLGNWGVAIILLTVVVKLVLYPLTNWSMRSMERMRALQPKMTALKERFGKDKEKFQIEMMKLYREEKVNPFGGCLPLLIQLPIWIALYRTILSTAELYNATFIPGWIEDLSAPEPGIVKFLPIAMGISMFLMQKMTPQAATLDEMQQKMQKFMLYFFPPFFTFIMYGLPSGLTLYIFVNNILSIAQQLWIRKRLAAETAAAAAGR
jgi:YidC/Oxa1 family membrane protein insertase